jgi:LacI family transcriptional regulator
VNLSLDQFFWAKAGPPDAIFALNDSLGLPALEALRHRAVRVPEDVALVSMGDYPLARNPLIGLSSIPEPIIQMASMAAHVLLDLMDGRAKAPVHRTVETSEFIVRRSM